MSPDPASLPAPEQDRHRNRFDVLRLFAALLVLWSHAFPLGGRPAQEPLARTLGLDTMGGVGVLIFFATSGYLVTQSLHRTANLWTFTRRRAVRIFPALVAMTLVVTVVIGPLVTRLDVADYARNPQTWDFLRNASAWAIRYPLPGVFESNPLPHAVNGSLWSLPYELQCYGALVLLALLPGRLWVKTAAVMAALGMALAARAHIQPPLEPFSSLVGLDLFHCKLGLTFALGALLALGGERVQPTGWMPLAAGLALLALPAGALQLAAFWVLVGTLTLWLATRALWLPAIPSRMGDWSYGTFLWGFPVQQVLAQTGLAERSFGAFVLASTVMTLAMAALSWHWVEKPALRWR